ncbi:MAG TPA: hypothetical protein VL991_10290 [Terracidiphilus sp.]|nr:hypothetical protein [Terracidiphilus sp.]
MLIRFPGECRSTVRGLARLLIFGIIIAAAAIIGPLVTGGVLGQDTAKQDAPQVQEPDYANSFFFLDSSGSLKPLERQPVGFNGKIRAMGFGGAKTAYQIQNEHSSVRFASGAPITIIVKMENRDLDPSTLIVLYPVQPEKGHRELVFSSVGFMGMHQKSDVQNKQLQMVFAKYGQSSVKITPASPLPAGEYAIAPASPQPGQQLMAYCFGVD